jgi:hypothetical protein
VGAPTAIGVADVEGDLIGRRRPRRPLCGMGSSTAEHAHGVGAITGPWGPMISSRMSTPHAARHVLVDEKFGSSK